MSVEPGIVDANVLVYASMRTLPSIWHRVLCSMQGAGHDDALRHLTSALRILFRRHQSPARFKAAYGCRHHSRHNGLTLFLHFLPIPARTVKDGHPVPQPTVTGGAVFDLQLAAAMLANGVQRIYSYNTSDFEGFKELAVVEP